MTKEWVIESTPAIRVRSMTSACIPRYICLQVFVGQVGERPDYEVQLTRDEAKQVANALQNAI